MGVPLPVLGPVIAAGSWLLLQQMGYGGNAAGPMWTAVGLISVLAWYLLRFRAPTTAPQLTRDARGNPISSVETYFSESFWEAREKFRRAVEAIPGWELHTLNVIGPSYTTDIAVLPGTGDGLVLHLSGGGPAWE